MYTYMYTRNAQYIQRLMLYICILFKYRKHLDTFVYKLDDI